MCTNRLVQHGLQVRLQLFKTQNKGWGIRCLDDVAKGSFVCIYAGEGGGDGEEVPEGLGVVACSGVGGHSKSPLLFGAVGTSLHESDCC